MKQMSSSQRTLQGRVPTRYVAKNPSLKIVMVTTGMIVVVDVY